MEKTRMVDKQYLTINRYSRFGAKLKHKWAFIWHWTEWPGATAQNIRDAFEGLKHGRPAYWDSNQFWFASTQAVCGLDGEIIEMMPLDEVAWQVGSTKEMASPYGQPYAYPPETVEMFGDYCESWTSPNWCVVGIELCHPDKTGKFRNETIDSAIKYTADVMYRMGMYNKPLLRHWDIVGWKKCPLWFCEHEEEWEEIQRSVEQLLYWKVEGIHV